MSKKFKGIKKFLVNKKVCFIMIIVFIIAAAVWYVCYTDLQNISIQTSLSEYNEIEFEKMMSKKAKLDTACNVTLTLVSISFSSLLTTLFIETKEKNNIINDVMIHDLFTSEYFINKLNEEEFNNLLFSLENNKYFKGNRTKSEMYSAVKEKLNNSPLDNKPLYYEKCSYDIKCKEYPNYIEKEFLKTIKVKSLTNAYREKSFILLSVANNLIKGLDTSCINSFKIDGKSIDLNSIKKTSFKLSALNKKQGYDTGINHCYDGIIDFSNNHAKTIEIEYVTRTPKNDTTYSCRLPYPCKCFNFSFSLDSENYNINPIAFGFIDDGENSPNRAQDRKNVTINFEDWIFPLDGVCIYLEKKTCNQ